MPICATNNRLGEITKTWELTRAIVLTGGLV